MGNHSDTGELLEEARAIAVTEKNASFGDTLIDEFGNTIKLDKSPEELDNPTRLKSSKGDEILLMRNKPLLPLVTDGSKSKKKKTS